MRSKLGEAPVNKLQESVFVRVLNDQVDAEASRVLGRGGGVAAGEDSVGGTAESTGATYLDRNRIRYTGYDTARAALDALVRGEQDAVVYDAPLLRYLANRELKGQVTVLPRVFARQTYAIALPQESPWRERINQAVLRETASDEWAELIERYLGR